MVSRSWGGFSLVPWKQLHDQVHQFGFAQLGKAGEAVAAKFPCLTSRVERVAVVEERRTAPQRSPIDLRCAVPGCGHAGLGHGLAEERQSQAGRAPASTRTKHYYSAPCPTSAPPPPRHRLGDVRPSVLRRGGPKCHGVPRLVFPRFSPPPRPSLLPSLFCRRFLDASPGPFRSVLFCPGPPRR